MKTAFVTGPARGIGEAVARGLAARGWRLALVGLERERMEALARELGSQHVAIDADVTDQAAMERAASEALRVLGQIDVVVANAGIASLGTVATTPMRDLQRVIDVNLGGVVRTVSVTLQSVLASRGYYLLVSSAAAIAAAPGLATYCATKSGVEQFGNALRLEVARHGVDVGVAHPSWIATDLVLDAQRDVASFAALIRKLPGPLGKVTTLEQCADALIDGIAHRRRQIFVPRSLGMFARMRNLLAGALTQRIVERDTRELLPAMEQEIRAVGRSFGANSVESQR